MAVMSQYNNAFHTLFIQLYPPTTLARRSACHINAFPLPCSEIFWRVRLFDAASSQNLPTHWVLLHTKLKGIHLFSDFSLQRVKKCASVLWSVFTFLFECCCLILYI